MGEEKGKWAMEMQRRKGMGEGKRRVRGKDKGRGKKPRCFTLPQADLIRLDVVAN
jgi:hypothetical protein